MYTTAFGGRAIRTPAGKELLAVDGPPLRSARDALSLIHLQGEGVEIGALHFPAMLSQRASVRYVDYVTREYSLSIYNDITSAVEVDILDDGEILDSLPDNSLDFVVANHFLEHSKDPIGTIKVHLRKLRPGGALFYALPDRQHSFDHKRPNTPFDHLIIDHEFGTAEGDRAHYAEFSRLVDGIESDVEVAAKVEHFIKTDNRIHFHAWDGRATRRLFQRMREYMKNSFDIAESLQNGAETITILKKAA